MERINDTEELQFLDHCEQANSRISAISSLLMSCGDNDVPPAEELRTVAHLIYDESRKLQNCLRSVSKNKQPTSQAPQEA